MLTCKLAFGAVAALMMIESCRRRGRQSAALCVGHRGLSRGRERRSKPGKFRLRCLRSNTRRSAACSAPSSSSRASIPLAATTWPKTTLKAFTYFRAIADQYADINPSSPVAPYVGEAFVALGQYHLDGIAAMPLAANAAYAADLFRHAASYFGNADAQYDLALLYLKGEGVEKDVGLAVNWLAMAAKKQHVAAQATLGEILWRGTDVRQREARGLALITLAHENAKASGKEAEMDRRSLRRGLRQVRRRDPQGGRRSASGARRYGNCRHHISRGEAGQFDRAAGYGPRGKAGRAACGRRPVCGRHSAQQNGHASGSADRALGRLWHPEHRRRRAKTLGADGRALTALDGELDKDRHVV